MKPLQTIWRQKHNKETDEGEVLRSLAEIRVQPSPSWDDERVRVRVRLWFLKDPKREFGQEFLDEMECVASEWMEMISTEGTRYELDYLVSNYDEMSASEYISSDQLDFDYLSA